MPMHVRVDQAVHKAVRNFTTHNYGVQQEMHSKLSKGVKIEVPVADDAREEPRVEVRIEPEDICGLGELIVQTGLPARGVEGTKEQF